jgi:hypothetical protein
MGETHLMEASATSPRTSSEQIATAKKSWRLAALTATPIVLTVVATALAGLSTSEMTLAQYHRSLAAQNQSKASDQWGFFQAKRLRGTGMEEGFDALPPRSKSSRGVQPRRLEAASHQFTRALQEAERQAAGLEKGLGGMRVPQGTSRPPVDPKKVDTQGLRKHGTQDESAAEPVRQADAQLQQAAQQCTREAESTEKMLKQKMADPETRSAFAFLSGDQLPQVDDVTLDQPTIDQAVQSISDRVKESELMPILRRISEDDLHRAIDTAEGNARRFESAGKPVGKTLEEIGRIVREQIARAGDFHEAVADYRMVLEEARPALDAKAWKQTQPLDASLEKSDAAVQAAAEELDNLFKMGRYSYTARRQKRESDYHLKTAGLYEVQVHLNSLTSDRHRTRSKLFFFGMLAAQAGVTIASLSLAVQKRNVLWALAGLAGIAAVTFSGWVYLYM